MKVDDSSSFYTVCALALVMLVASTSCVAKKKPDALTETDPRIVRVVRGLRPVIVIKGQPEPGWTIAERLKHYRVPGVSIAVISNGKLAWARGYGFAENDRPVDTNTVFQAASIGKPISAMVALRLVEEGKLSLDEDVNAKLRSWKVPENEFTQKEKVTLRRILSHSAGLTVHGFRGYEEGEPMPALPDILDGRAPANSQPVRVVTTPGGQESYSGGGYEVMEQLITDVTGRRFAELARHYVLDPLGMKRSTYQQPLPAEFRSNAAAAHDRAGTELRGRWRVHPETAAAALWTTPSDLARLLIEVQSGNHILQPATKRAMLTKVLRQFGMGLEVGETAGRRWFLHNGSNAGFESLLFGYLEDGDGAVVMTNGTNGDLLIDEILRSIATEYGWADYKSTQKTVVRVAPETLQSYTGNYQLTPTLLAMVTYEDGKLFAGEPGKPKVQLYPESETNFFCVDVPLPPVSFAGTGDASIAMTIGPATAKRIDTGSTEKYKK